MDTYLITVADHQKDMKKYYICATKTAADMLLWRYYYMFEISYTD